MEMPKIFSNVGCSILSDSIDFTNGITKVGSVGFKVAALTAVSFAMLKLYQHATDKNPQSATEILLPRLIQWDPKKGITIPPIITTKYALVPTDVEKKECTLYKRTAIRMPSLGDALLLTAIFSLAVMGTRAVGGAVENTLWNTTERYFQCKA